MLFGDFEVGPGGTNAFETMVASGSWLNAVWFVLFTIIVSMLLLNMLLAVIMDVYTEVKGSIGSDSETVWSQTVEIIERQKAKQSGNHIDLSAILFAIDPNHLDRRTSLNDPCINVDD